MRVLSWLVALMGWAAAAWAWWRARRQRAELVARLVASREALADALKALPGAPRDGVRAVHRARQRRERKATARA